MLLIKTFIAPSSIHGIGLFAAQSVTHGTPVWKFDATVDPIFPREHLENAPEPWRTYLRRHCYPNPHNKNEIMIDGDDCRYMNHSDRPNVDFSRDADHGYALRYIAYGQELTCNYEQFAPGWYELQGRNEI